MRESIMPDEVIRAIDRCEDYYEQRENWREVYEYDKSEDIEQSLYVASQQFDVQVNIASAEVVGWKVQIGEVADRDIGSEVRNTAADFENGKFATYRKEMKAAKTRLEAEMDESFPDTSALGVTAEDDLAMYVESLRESSVAQKLAQKYLSVEGYEHLSELIDDAVWECVDELPGPAVDRLANEWSEFSSFVASTRPAAERPGRAMSADAVREVFNSSYYDSEAREMMEQALEGTIGKLPFKMKMNYIVGEYDSDHFMDESLGAYAREWVDAEFNSRFNQFKTDESYFSMSTAINPNEKFSDGRSVGDMRAESKGALDISRQALVDTQRQIAALSEHMPDIISPDTVTEYAECMQNAGIATAALPGEFGVGEQRTPAHDGTQYGA